MKLNYYSKRIVLERIFCIILCAISLTSFSQKEYEIIQIHPQEKYKELAKPYFDAFQCSWGFKNKKNEIIIQPTYEYIDNYYDNENENEDLYNADTLINNRGFICMVNDSMADILDNFGNKILDYPCFMPKTIELPYHDWDANDRLIIISDRLTFLLPKIGILDYTNKMILKIKDEKFNVSKPYKVFIIETSSTTYIFNEHFKKLMSTPYLIIKPFDNHFIVMKREDKDKNKIVSARYLTTDKKSYCEAEVDIRMNKGIINYKNELIFPFKHEFYNIIYDNNKAYFWAWDRGKISLYDEKGKFLLQDLYLIKDQTQKLKNDNYRCIYDDWNCPYIDARESIPNQNYYKENFHLLKNKQNKYGIVNKFGSIILPFQSDSIYQTTNPYRDNTSSDIIIANEKGNQKLVDLRSPLQSFLYDSIKQIEGTSYFIVKQSSKFNIIDSSGKHLFAKEFKEIKAWPLLKYYNNQASYLFSCVDENRILLYSSEFTVIDTCNEVIGVMSIASPGSSNNYSLLINKNNFLYKYSESKNKFDNVYNGTVQYIYGVLVNQKGKIISRNIERFFPFKDYYYIEYFNQKIKFDWLDKDLNPIKIAFPLVNYFLEYSELKNQNCFIIRDTATNRCGIYSLSENKIILQPVFKNISFVYTYTSSYDYFPIDDYYICDHFLYYHSQKMHEVGSETKALIRNSSGCYITTRIDDSYMLLFNGNPVSDLKFTNFYPIAHTIIGIDNNKKFHVMNVNNNTFFNKIYDNIYTFTRWQESESNEGWSYFLTKNAEKYDIYSGNGVLYAQQKTKQQLIKEVDLTKLYAQYDSFKYYTYNHKVSDSILKWINNFDILFNAECKRFEWKKIDYANNYIVSVMQHLYWTSYMYERSDYHKWDFKNIASAFEINNGKFKQLTLSDLFYSNEKWESEINQLITNELKKVTFSGDCKNMDALISEIKECFYFNNTTLYFKSDIDIDHHNRKFHTINLSIPLKKMDPYMKNKKMFE